MKKEGGVIERGVGRRERRETRDKKLGLGRGVGGVTWGILLPLPPNKIS